MICYLFSGLGADKRAFANLNLSGYELKHIIWETPQKNETIKEYSQRLLLQITTSNSIFIGLSFGGIMAIETAKHIKPEKIILISSVRTKKEIPFYYRWMAKTKLHKLMPGDSVLTNNFILNYLFGIKEKKDKELLSDIIRDTDPFFMKWAIEKIVFWDNYEIPDNLIHIHGTDDKIFPVKYVRPDVKVKDGGHFMIVNKAMEIERRILKIIGEN